MQALRLNRFESKKKKVSKRDPNAPKPAKSAFMYVLEAKRDDILQERPNLSYNQLAQEVGKIWHSMSDAEKSPWRDLAAEDKARYDAEMANYEPIYVEPERRRPHRRRRRRDPDAPKAAKTAFICFSSEKRDEICIQYPELGFADQMKRIGQLWNEMTEQDKQEWNEKARLDKMRFDKEMLEYTGTQNAYV